jgi:hypothetical protein
MSDSGKAGAREKNTSAAGFSLKNNWELWWDALKNA